MDRKKNLMEERKALYYFSIKDIMDVKQIFTDEGSTSNTISNY
jgi:hypothetical protein